MGFKGISFSSLLLICFILVLLFGTKRLREAGSDLSTAIKNFRKGMQDETNEKLKDQ